MHYKGVGLHGDDAVKFAKRVLDRMEKRGLTTLEPNIIMRGVSGLVVGSVVAAKLRCPMAVVRKKTIDEDASHSCEAVEGAHHLNDDGPVVIVDDFVSSGRTLVTMLTALADYGVPDPDQKVYLCLYDQDSHPTFSSYRYLLDNSEGIDESTLERARQSLDLLSGLEII
jgi:phosphoribosylpyrophosphate synthetase